MDTEKIKGNRGLIDSMNNEIKKIMIKLEGLSHQELKNYIFDRLHGRKTSPAIDSRSGEEPEFILVAVYSKSKKREFKNSFEKIIKYFCWRAEQEEPEGTFFSRVLNIIEDLKITSSTPHLTAILDIQKDYLQKTPGYYKRDLFLHILVVLVRLQNGHQFIIHWHLYLKNKNYAAVAFAGLIKDSLENAMRYLPDFLKTAMKYSQHIPVQNTLVNLVHRYRNNNIVWEIFQKCREESKAIRNYLFRVMKNISSIRDEVESYRTVLFPEEHIQREVEDISRPKTKPLRKEIDNFLNFSPKPIRVSTHLAK